MANAPLYTLRELMLHMEWADACEARIAREAERSGGVMTGDGGPQKKEV